MLARWRGLCRACWLAPAMLCEPASGVDTIPTQSSPSRGGLGGDGVGSVFVFSRHSGEGRNPFCSWLLIFRAHAKPDSRPCAECPPSLAASHFLLLAQEKVTKEKGTLAAAVAGLLPGDYARALRRFADSTSVY